MVRKPPVPSDATTGLPLSRLLVYANSDWLTKDGGAKRLRVDLQEIKLVEKELGDQLEKDPTTYLPLVCCALTVSPCMGVSFCRIGRQIMPMP